MRSCKARVTLVSLMCIILPAVCFAGDVGKIAGSVVDKKTGDPLKYANVVVLGTPLGGMSFADGTFFVLNVAPGKYDVQASYIGYTAVTIRDVVVKPDLTTNLVFELEESVADVLEPIVIQAEKPLVQVDITSTRNIFLAEELEALPIDNPVNVINFVSGASVDATGTHIRGGRATEVGYYVDDTSIQDPIGNNAMLSLSNQSVNEMVVFTGGFNAEYGNASSGIVNIITSEGTDEFHGSMDYRMYLPAQMFWKKSDTGDPLDTDEQRLRAALTGPVFERGQTDMRFAVAAEGTDWDDWQPRVETLNRPGRQRLYDGTVTLRHGKTKVKFGVNVENAEHVSSYDSYRLYERVRVPDSFRWTKNDNYRFAVSASHMITDNSFAKASFSVVDGTLEIAQPGKNWDPTLEYQENIDMFDWDLDIRRDDDNFIISGDNPYYDYQKRRIYAFRGSYTHQKGKNEAKTGVDLSVYNVEEKDIFASTQNFYIWEYDVEPRAGAVYAQDKLEFEGLIMNMGLRLDFFDPNHKVFKDFDNPYDLDAPDSLWHGPNNDQAPIELERYDADGEYVGGGLVDADIKWKLSPRLGVSHPISAETYLHFQYGHFFQMPSFDFLYENEKFHTRGRWLIAGNPDLEAEKTVAYEVGVNHLLSVNTAVDLTFFYKDITDMTESVVVGPTKISNPQGRENYSTYLNVGYGNVRGFEINLKRRHFNNWHYHGAYTFMVAKGFSSNANEGAQRRFDEEDEIPTQQFYLDWDRRHSFLLTGGYGGPDTWGVDVAMTYATGAPYTDPRTLSRKPSRNNVRFPSISNVDLEVYRAFTLFGVKATAYTRATNLFDQRNLVAWDDTDQDLRNWLVANPGDFLGPFDDFTIYGPPRAVLGGVKVSF